MSTHSYIQSYGTFKFHRRQKQLFEQAVLPQIWRDRYPMLFDEDDLRITRNQPAYHFYEWLGAILLYETTGCLILNQQYQFSNHPRKRDILKKIGSDTLIAAVDDDAETAQCPDLLAYLPDYSNWWFFEVKGPHDQLRPNQEARFRRIAEITGKPILTLSLAEAVDDLG